MKSIYIDSAAFLSMVALAEAGEEARAKVGYAYDAHDQPYALFIGTDAESGKVQRDKNGGVRLNLRAGSKRRTQQTQG